MTEALKTDWLEQAKREIAEENPLYSAWGPTAMASSISMWRDALVAERARNLELRQVLRRIAEGSGDHYCDCEHDTEDCCALVDPIDYFCAHCIAGKALKGLSHERD